MEFSQLNNKTYTYQEFINDEWLKFQEIFSPRKDISVRNKYSKNNKPIVDLIISFDIETSRIEINNRFHSFMYIWQMQFTSTKMNYSCTIYGRYWNQFVDIIDKLKLLNPNRRYVIYVHNLAYEYQFMKTYLSFDDTFFLSTRKPLVLRSDNIEFRCSYILTNMSLAQFSSKYCNIYNKMVGDLDYDICRYNDTELTEKELGYCLNDVRCLNEALYNLMKSDNDNLATIPLTSTGYVRRDVREAIRNNPSQITDHCKSIDEDVFKLLRKAFRGGNTHANRFKVGELLENVKSVDRASAYPTEMYTEPYPVNPKKFRGSFERILEIIKNGKAVLVELQISDVKLKHDVYCPYLASTKVFDKRNALVENGRILLLEEGKIVVTDLDLKIILDQYEFKVDKVLDCYTMNYEYLPESVLNVIKKYYDGKTQLKGIKEEEDFYMKSKNRLNSIYGMTVYNPYKDDYMYDDLYKIVHRVPNGGLLQEVLNKLALQKNLNYIVGVWVTAYARFELQKMIDLVGEDFVYCDTDSVKYIGDHDIEIDWYNSQWTLNCISSGRILESKDKHNINHIGGIFESEGVYKEFKTIGSKKYCYKYDDDVIHLTCAGAPKYCAKELSCVDDFEPGFEFKNAGLTTIYNEITFPRNIFIDGHEVQIASNIALINRHYMVSLEPTLEEVLKFLSTNYNDVKDGFSHLNSKGVYNL